ncbi:hypothetical protein ACNPQM_21785 [Streptomyces sp. NPDC056231]|uniref:hypothetical protein n=1 Tax=Streptomyces sp. NPDC056231 TaxID=3345755 RepID=UPI003AAE3F78
MGLPFAGARAGRQPPADLAAHHQRQGSDVQPDLPRSPHENPGQPRIAVVKQRPGEHRVNAFQQRGALGQPVHGGRAADTRRNVVIGHDDFPSRPSQLVVNDFQFARVFSSASSVTQP